MNPTDQQYTRTREVPTVDSSVQCPIAIDCETNFSSTTVNHEINSALYVPAQSPPTSQSVDYSKNLKRKAPCSPARVQSESLQIIDLTSPRVIPANPDCDCSNIFDIDLKVELI